MKFQYGKELSATCFASSIFVGEDDMTNFACDRHLGSFAWTSAIAVVQDLVPGSETSVRRHVRLDHAEAEGGYQRGHGRL